MEKNINWDDFTPVSSGNADDVNWSDFSPVNAQESGALSDLGKSLKSGVQKLPGIVTGLADLPAALLTGYRPFTEAADWMGEATGFQPGKWAKDTKFSQGHEDSRKEVDAAWQDGSAADIAKAYISNPNYTLNQVVESLPSMAAGGYASKALMGAGAAAGVVGDAAAGVATKAATPGLLARTVGEKWAAPVAGGAGEGAVTAGQQMDDYTGEDQQKNAWASLGAGAGTGLIGVGAGRLANHLGFETAETAMAKIGQRETVDAAEAAARAAGNGTPDVPLSAKRRILGGMVSEGLLQELPQSAQEQMWQNYANDKPLMEGVTRAGVEGALAGVVMGAGANVRGQGNPPRTVEEIEQQVSELPEHQQNAARATLNAQLQAEARMAGLAEEEQGQQDVPPGNPNDYRATPAWAKPPQDAEQDFGNYDDEILQSTGMEQRPTPHPVRTAVQDAADAGGGLSAAAGLAMDSGITPIPAYMPPAIQEQPAEPEAAQVVLQNRDRTSAASIAQMQEIAANPDYLQVGPSRDMASGAPVVFGDLPGTALLGRPERVVDGTGQRVSAQYAVVDAGDVLASNNADGTTVPEYAQGLPGKLRAVAGNGRTAGLQAAYGSDRAGSYRAELIGDAETLGIDPAAINAMQRPVLVRVMNQSDITADMGDRTNITKTQKLSPVEQAANDSRRFDVGNLAFDDRGNPTEQSLGGFIASLPVSERGDMLNPDGSVTRQATDRLMAATFKQAYESDELVQLYAQAADPDARAVLAAAADASGVMASLKGAGQAFDVRSAVTDAVKMAVNASARGLKLSDVIKNTDFDFNPEAYPVAEFLAANIRSPKAMAEGLRRWGQLARQQAQTEEDNSRQGGLLGPAPTMSRAELFSHIGSTYNPTEQSVAPRVQSDGQVPQASLQESPAPLPVPGNYTGAPSATMGTRTEASAGPAFGLKDALAMIRAKKQEAAQAQAQPPIAPVDAVAPESLAPALHGLSESQQDTPVDTAQAWASMPTDQRKAVAAEAGLPPIVSNNIGKAQWEAINPKAQGKLAEVMAAQAQPAQEQEAVPEDAPPALTPYAPADIEQRQAQQTEATRAEAEAAADAQAKPEAAQEEASVKKPGRGVLAKLEAQRAQKQREQEDADASAKAAEQVRNAELVYNAKRRLAAAYRNEPHGGIDEDYETLRGMLEVRANDSDNPNSGMARDVLDSFDDSIANAKLKEGRTQPQAAASEAPTLELTGQTAEEARAQAASQQAEAARKQGETTQAQSEDERKRIAAASVKAADSFELGQDPMDSLTGQKDVFGAMEEAPEPPAWSPESHVQIAADSVANLRKDDVYRLFDELPKEADNFHDLRVHIIGNRPDLAGAVMEAIGEIGMPNRKAATQDDENRLAESKARVLARGQAVKDYLASGGTVRHANQLRVTPLNHPSQIKVSKDGVRMQAGRDKSAPDGVRWAYLTFGEVDQLASQVPGLDPDLAPDFVRGMAEAKLEQQEQQAQAAPKNLKKGIERAQQNAQSAKAAEITTNEGSNRVGKFAYDIEPTSGYMLAEFSSPPTADGLRIGAENAEELKQQIQRAMDTHDASPYLKMRWKRPGAGQVTLVKLVSLPNSADKSELYEVTFSGGGSMRIDAHRMEESAARDSEAASEEDMAKAKIEREAYQKAEEAAKQSEKDQAARAEAFNLEVKRFADSMGYTALRAGSVRAALKRVHNYEGMGIMSALEFMKKMVANGHAPVEHLPVPQGMPQLHETLGMTDEQVSKFKARRLKNDTTPTYTISGFDITKTESDFAKYLQEGIAQAQQNAAQATQQAENLAWVEKSTGYEPARPAGRPYVLKAGELGRATTVAGKFGEKPKFSDMNRYFASPEEAQDWGKANGYLVGSNPYAATQPEATSKTLAQPQRFTLSIPSVFENMPYVASAPVPTDGDVVSSRIITTNTSITKSDLRTLGLGEDKKKIYAWRVSVARWPDGAFSSLIEAMDMDYGRSPKGEVVAYFKLVDNAEAVNRIAPAIAKAALQDWETASKPVQPSVFDAPVDQGASNTPEATGKTLARSAAEKVLGNRFELSENDKEAKNVSAIAGTKDAYITQDGKELHIVEAVANENLKNATTEAIQEALEKRRPGTDAAKRLQAELDNRGGAVAKPASLKEGIAQARANKAGAAQTQYNNGKLDTDPNDMDAAKIERGYSNLSHNLTAKVEMERKWYVDAVQAFHDALAPVAQTKRQAEKLGDLVDAFKADYVQRRNRVLTVAESSYSAAIAGRSKLNTGQVNTRADAWARAEQAFSQWVAEEKEIAKAVLLELRTEGQRDADKQSAENKRVTELVEPVVRSILNLGAIDEGQMPGMSRSSFADSASRKMAALHKNGEVAALEQVFEAIDEWNAAHKKPLFTSKSPVWGYRPAPTAKPVQAAKAEASPPAPTPAAPIQQETDAADAAPKFSRTDDTETKRQFSDTERTYGGRNAYDKAKAEGKTKLTYGQWVQVRTPNFKGWFGDWEAARAQQRLDAMAPVKVNVPEEWRGLDTKELRHQVEIALLNLAESSEPLHHPEIGDVNVSKRGVKKVLSSSADPAKLMLMNDLRHTFEASIFSSSTPTNKDKPGISGYEKLLVKIEIDHNQLVAAFSVARHADGRQFYNAVTLEDGQEKTPVASPQDTPKQVGERATSANTGVSDFIRRPLERVNPNDVSKVVDPQTGEPLVVYHGTDQSERDGDAFRTFKIAGGAEPGVFFTDDPVTASEYAVRFAEYSEAPSVFPVFLSMPSAKVIEASGKSFSLANKVAFADGNPHGIIIRNVVDGHSGATNVFVAANPTQIKSATGNNDNFDGTNADIRRSGQQSPTTPATPIATVRAALTQAYGKLADQLERRGLVTVVQTQEQAIEAAAQARAAKTGQSVEQAKRELMASVKNSVALQTESENFKRWFGDSKVVDANGKPLVVYHGTKRGGFFDFKKKTGGIYFSPDREFSEQVFASQNEYEGAVFDVYLSMENPFDARWKGMSASQKAELREYIDNVFDEDDVNDVREKMGDPDWDPFESFTDGEFWTDAGRNFQDAVLDQIRLAGYDGAIIPDSPSYGWNLDSYVVFSPTQIKSSTGNDGNFSPNDPDIRRSADGNVQGFFDPQSGQAFLVADHLTAEAAPGVLMHEVGIHMAADKTLAPLFNRAKLMLSMQKNDPFMQRVKAKMDAAGETSGEEVAAYMVEEYERSRANAPASVARWLSDLLATVKAWMHRKGIIGADGLTVADIAAVARANAKSLAQGQVGQQSNADIRFSRTAAAINASTGTLTPKQQQANDRVFGLAKEPTLKEQFDSLKANFGLKARQALVDQFAAIKQLDPKAYMLARMSKASDGTLEASMLYGIPFLNNGVPDVKIGDGGFANVLASLNGEHYRFMKWVAAQRAERLKAEGKENLMTNDDISALKTLNQGQMPDGRSRVLVYGSAMDKLNAYNEAMLKMAMESGHIDQDTFNVMKDQPYVPFYRIMEDEKFQGPKSSSALVNQKAWHKLKGGTNQLNADLLQNMLMNWSHLLQASARNRAALATMDEAEKMAIAYQVPATTKGAVRVMRDGFAEHWMVEDPHLLEAVGALNYTVSPLMKPLTKMKQILTMAVTVNPTFKIRNLIRDSVSAIAQSELSYNPVANVAKGWKLTASDSQIYASMLAGGGLIKFGTQENTDRLRLQIEKLGGQVLNKTTAQGLMDRASKAWDAYSEFGDRTENVNRVALYDKLRKMGRSHAEASFESRDLMDFSMGGTMPLVRFLTQTVPFLNARLVGLDKLGRAAVADPRKFGTMAAAVAIASVALMMMYGDDDDWKKREDWDRDAYWWFKIGGTAFRIPKPFEVGAIGTMAERTFELMFEKEMTNKRFRERIAHMFSQTFAFDPVPQAVKPLLDVYSNKDSFTKRAIESQSDQRMRPQDRYNERTSEVARMLGKLGLPEPSQLIKGEYVGLSPKQIDHLIKGYFSWVGVTATAAADAVIRPAMGKGERPDMRLKDMFMVGNFVETLPTGSSRYVTQMYEQARQINQAYASYREALKSGEVEKAKDIKAANIERFRNRLVFDHAQEQLSKLNQQAKKIEASRAMTGEEKRQRLTDIEQRRGAIAQRVSGRIAA